MEINVVVGERLKKLRKEYGLSQDGLAEIFNVQRQVISYYETGKRALNISELIRFADYFNVSTDYLLGLSEYKNSQEEEELNTAVDLLSNDEKQLYMELKKELLKCIHAYAFNKKYKYATPMMCELLKALKANLNIYTNVFKTSLSNYGSEPWWIIEDEDEENKRKIMGPSTTYHFWTEFIDFVKIDIHKLTDKIDRFIIDFCKKQ